MSQTTNITTGNNKQPNSIIELIN